VAARIKIVWFAGSGPQVRLRKFYAYSAIFHIVLVVIFVFAPRLFGSSRANFSDDFLDVMYASLVADVGEEPVQAVVQPAQPVVEPRPEPPKPEPKAPPEETAAGGDVVHSAKAAPTPKKEDPKPVEPSNPEPVEDPGAEPDGGASTERVGDSSGGVSAAGEISLFGWYQSSVSRALYSTWRRPLLAGLREPLTVLISFDIQKNGSVTGLRVIESSGVQTLDRSALRAVADASPLPRLPPAWSGSSMTAAYLFEITPEDF
jgi:protein TonB